MGAGQVGKRLSSPYINSRNRLIMWVFQSFCRNRKLTVDAPLDLSIIRPTSGADETENSLRIKELDEVSSEEALRFKCLNRQR
jgi:hypothetical protein